MKIEEQLKLQAWLDGELSVREAEDVKAWLARDEEARFLLTELKNTSAALAGHEAAVKLPESREFFWSKVRREIEHQKPIPASRSEPKVGWWSFLARHLAPASGLAVLAFVMMLWLAQSRNAPASDVSEMEMASSDMGAYTYRNEAQDEKMTVVWFYNLKDDSQFTQPAVFASMDER